MSREYVDRLKADYRKTFGTPAGKHVLMNLYEQCHGATSTLPMDGNPIRMAVYEGKRVVLLHILDHLKVEPLALRKMHQEHKDERAREENQ